MHPGTDIGFTSDLLRPRPRGWWDVEATLAHFAMVTYSVDPGRVRPHVDARFDLDIYTSADGSPRVWVSMVPFQDQDFHFVAAPWPRFRFGQTNYRTYVIDRRTRQRAVWFFGTTLDSWSVVVPRYVWRLPWHRGRIQFDCAFDAVANRYTRYRMTTESAWAPAEIELGDTGEPVESLDGFGNVEATLVVLTHPLVGVFRRRASGGLGTYSVWHDRMACTLGSIQHARIDLFDRLGLVPFADQHQPHSVLIQRETTFTIHLPPKRLRDADLL